MERENSNTGSKQALKWLFASTKKQIPLVVVLVILTSVIACTGTIAALVSRFVIDNAIDGQTERFALFGIMLAGVYVLSVLLGGVQKYLSEKCRASVERAVKHRFFASVLKKKYESISGYHSGVLLNRITDDASIISDAATNILPNFVSMLCRLSFAFCVIVYYEPYFALVFAAGGILIFVATRIFRAKLKKMHKTVQETNEKTRSFWHECMVNLLAVKVFAAEDKMNDKSAQLQHNNYKARLKRSAFTALTSSAYGLVLYAGYVFAFLWCGSQLLLDVVGFSYGKFTAIMQLVGQVQQPFSGLSGIIPQYYNALASIERLMEIEDLPDEQNTAESIDLKEIYGKLKSVDFTGITFKYDRDYIFDNLNFSVKKGEFIGIVGNSGIGKSTLFKILLGVYQPQNGEISIVCEDGKIPCGSGTRRLFSYVPQGNLLFSGSIYENIVFVNPQADEEAVRKAVETSCASEFIDLLPDGINTQIGEKGLGLSEGQVQRLAIARALVAGSPIILLDEATSALDAATEAKLLENLRKLKEVTCLIVTHRKQALGICDRQLEIRNSNIEVAE